MKWPWNCISWNALKEKFHSVSFPLDFFPYYCIFLLKWNKQEIFNKRRYEERWKIVKSIIFQKNVFYRSYWKQSKRSLCKKYLHKSLPKNSCSVVLLTQKILYQNICKFVRKCLQCKCGAGLQPGTYFTRSFIL